MRNDLMRCAPFYILTILFLSACWKGPNVSRKDDPKVIFADRYNVRYDTVYAENDIDTPPAPIGGVMAIYRKLSYPTYARRYGIEGVVRIRFVVSPEGQPTNPVIVHSAHRLLDNAATKALLKSRFEPGRYNDQPVPTQMTLPLTFGLR